MDRSENSDEGRFTRVCKQCGRQFHSQRYRATCSPECKLERTRAAHRATYYKRIAANPTLNSQNWQQRKGRAAVDPAFAQVKREWESQQLARRRRLRREDPAYRDRLNAMTRARYDPGRKKDMITARLARMSVVERAQYIEARRAVAREHYRRHKAAYDAKRRRWLDSMSPERLARWMIRRRALDKARAQKVRDGIYADPATHDRFRAIQLEYERRYRANKRLRELMTLGSELLKKMEQTHE